MIVLIGPTIVGTILKDELKHLNLGRTSAKVNLKIEIYPTLIYFLCKIFEIITTSHYYMNIM